MSNEPERKNNSNAADQPRREFKTHIKEPRWQQIVSVIVIVAIIIAWLILQF
ncbi:MAG: hypothetical protein ACREHG_08975 [Candidatus Saccharimonadales bacterium]